MIDFKGGTGIGPPDSRPRIHVGSWTPPAWRRVGPPSAAPATVRRLLFRSLLTFLVLE